jgi:hypothetical protein
MVRECVATLLLLPAAGCSWMLDFSDRAIPKDAQPDAPYLQAECDFGEPNNTAATATALTPADTGPAAICAGPIEDHDFYEITVPAMTARVEIGIAFTHRTLGDLDLRLYDRAGAAVIAQSRGLGDGETLVCPGAAPACPALAAGDYVVEVFPAVPGAVNRYTIALTLTPM